MTEQEAEALAERLTRIWEPMCPISRPAWKLTDKLFSFECRVVGDMYVTFEQNFTDQIKDVDFSNQCPPEMEAPRRLVCFQCEEDIASFIYDNAPIFNAHYMPLFQRNCFLSGFNVEASAHEKAEWMQGFSREELEAWNLKI